jgi:hypothetical protein
MRNDWLNGRVAGLVGCAAFAGMLALVTPASAADYAEPVAPPPPAAYGPPVVAAPVVVVPAPIYAPVVVGAPYWYGRPYWRGYWGPRYAGWYGRPWGWRRW